MERTLTWNTKRFVCLATLLAACTTVEPRTQVMLIVGADEAVRGKVRSLRVEIAGSLEGSTAADATNYTGSFDPEDPAGARWPFRFALTPRGGEHGRRYKITLTALDAEEKTVAVLRSEGGFVKGKTLALALHFDASCVGEASLKCTAGDTCAQGTCVSASVDARSLPGLSEIDVGMSPPTGTINEPVSQAGGGGASGGAGAAAGSGGAGEAGGASGAGSGGMSGTGSIVTGVSDCGDGMLGPDERCDTMIRAPAEGACPSECMPQTCQVVKLEGSGCQARCTPTPITAAVSEDGCCPPGADTSSDSDCMAQCGNGKVESGETCDPPGSCPTLETCMPANACLMAVIDGAAESCNATCAMVPIQHCVPNDGCCPSGCARGNDSDCSASCGDGVVDSAARETCEPSSQSQPCPTNCNDNDACSFDLLTGSANNCNVTCTHLTISNPFPFDGCCPHGANANNDSDCTPMCGNGVVERGERCDGVCPDAAACDDRDSCTRDNVNGRDCGRQCTHSAIGPNTGGTDGCCPAGANANTDSDCQATCGNGVVEREERCDGNCPTPASCNDNKPCTADVIMGSGCERTCVHNDIGPNRNTPDGCCPNGLNRNMDADCEPAPPMCGNGMIETGEMCDGNCPMSCNDSMACTRDQLLGEGCQRRCMYTPITAPSGTTTDGCCLTGNDKWQDADCDAVCPNGHPEADEKCDGNCPTPTSCADSNECTEDGVRGDPCQIECTNVAIRSMSGDGLCCPRGSNKNVDSDCPAVCGNNVRELPGEECDPPAPGSCSNTCQTIVPDPPPPVDGGP
jgi:hypothetical protein